MTAKGPYAILTDTTLCTGCETCVKACKAANKLGPDRPREGQGSAIDLSISRYTTIVRKPGDRSVRRQCFHCIDPACVSACIVGALQKTPEGPVYCDYSKCLGCRYCFVACPFDVPRYEWENAVPYMRKCTLCRERLVEGGIPACVEACPEKATIFGTREEMLAEAHRRLKAKPERYAQRVFGEKEVGGTSILLISDIDLSFLAWTPDVPEKPMPEMTWAALKKVPPTILAVGGLMAGVYWTIGRRMKMAELRATESGAAPDNANPQKDEEKKNA